MQTDIEIFARNLKKIRLAKKITQKQLAEKSGLSIAFIGFVERSERNITLKNVIKIWHGLDCKADELFEDLSP
jgi:transcriptional regulator with XRE-family HTH domain